MNGADAPVTGFTFKAVPAPKSSTIRSPVTGLNASPRVCALEPAIATLWISLPFGLNTKRWLGPGYLPLGIEPEGGDVDIPVGTDRQPFGPGRAGWQYGKGIGMAAIECNRRNRCPDH